MSAQYYVLAWKDPTEDVYFNEQADTESSAENLAVQLVKEQGYLTAVICKALKQVNRAHEVVTL